MSKKFEKKLTIYENGYELGYECGKEDLINKACEWLNKGGYFVNNKESLEDFRKAMEE